MLLSTIYNFHRNYLDCVAGFVSKKADIWHLITDLRAQYHFWISDDKLPSKLTALSIDGTIAGAIQEVKYTTCNFVLCVFI